MTGITPRNANDDGNTKNGNPCNQNAMYEIPADMILIPQSRKTQAVGRCKPMILPQYLIGIVSP